jgi:hypothetical protein
MNTCYSCYAETTETTACSTCQNVLHADCAIEEGGALYCDMCYTTKDDPSKTSFEMPEFIRRTYIETYRSCPFKFLKEVIEGCEQPPTCYTQIGIDLHDYFEKGLLDRSYHKQAMLDDFQKVWDNKYPPMDLFESEKQKANMYQRAMNSIETYYTIVPNLPMPFITEETIFYKVGDDLPDVRFTMDAIIENEAGNLELLDWKTGKVMVGVKLSSDLQAPLYIYGVQEKYGRQVDRFTYYYVHEGKERVFERVAHNKYVCTVGKREYHVDLEEMVKEVRRVFSHIKKGKFGIPHDTKKMHFTCKMCHIREQGLCRGADQEAWYQK